jgi:hypothetical protein
LTDSNEELFTEALRIDEMTTLDLEEHRRGRFDLDPRTDGSWTDRGCRLDLCPPKCP